MSASRWTRPVVLTALAVLVIGAGGFVALRVFTATHDVVAVSVGPTLDDLRVTGTAHAAASVVSDGGAAVGVVPGPDDDGWALQFPARGATGAVAVAVVAPGPRDPLSPGTRDFSFGVDLQVDPGTDTDGDNVVQHGLSDDVGQYKIELDRGRFACTVKGADGRVRAQVPDERPAPGVWYRLTCDRVGDRLDLQVQRLTDDVVWTTTASGPIGEVRTAQPETPLSIGGKLTPSRGLAVWQPDQFNGAIANVWLRIG